MRPGPGQVGVAALPAVHLGQRRELGRTQRVVDAEHDPEGSTIAFERSQLASLLRQTDDRLAEVEAALQRVADGTYGRCERCGHPVEPERLQARPTARTHVAC